MKQFLLFSFYTGKKEDVVLNTKAFNKKLQYRKLGHLKDHITNYLPKIVKKFLEKQ